MSKLIFTDIDGVLHPFGTVRQVVVGDEWQITGEGLFRWAPLLWELIAPHDIRLVVHSSWRYNFSLDELRAWFPEPMQARIADVTRLAGRHESIVDYLADNRAEDFIVLDDEVAQFPEEWAPLVACDSETGISDPDVLNQIRAFVNA
jgi:hypothetical protein